MLPPKRPGSPFSSSDAPSKKRSKSVFSENLASEVIPHLPLLSDPGTPPIETGEKYAQSPCRNIEEDVAQVEAQVAEATAQSVAEAEGDRSPLIAATSSNLEQEITQCRCNLQSIDNENPHTYAERATQAGGAIDIQVTTEAEIEEEKSTSGPDESQPTTVEIIGNPPTQVLEDLDYWKRRALKFEGELQMSERRLQEERLRSWNEYAEEEEEVKILVQKYLLLEKQWEEELEQDNKVVTSLRNDLQRSHAKRRELAQKLDEYSTTQPKRCWRAYKSLTPGEGWTS